MSKRTGPSRPRASRKRSRTAARAEPSRRADRSTTNRPGDAAAALARLIDTPHLARVVPYLAPEAVHRIIRHCGLEACGEVVAAATPAQLVSVFDLDLWSHGRPGLDDQLDVDRFGEWLEFLADAGSDAAAAAAAAMGNDLITAGLSRYIRVFDPATFEPTAPSDDEPIEAARPAGGALECEVGGYLVRARRADGWGAIVSLLVGLDADHPDRFHSVMRACRRISNSEPEVDGLDELLMEPEQLLYDVARDRDERRTRQGYSSPADARAFLDMARRSPARSQREATTANPLAAAYFRSAADAAAVTQADAPPPDVATAAKSPAGLPEGFDAVVDALADAGLLPERPRALLGGGSPRFAEMRRLMEYAHDHDAALYLARGHELAFLANVLAAGCSIQSRAFTPHEASDAAAAICNLGLECWPSRGKDAVPAPAAAAHTGLPDAFLVDHDLVSAFEVGWRALHDEVCLFAADQLIAALSSIRRGDEIREDIDALRIALTKERAAGTVWRAADRLDVLSTLDLPAWASLLGLLAECPVIADALTATLQGRGGSVDPAGFELISTCAQIEQVRTFMARLPSLLGC